MRHKKQNSKSKLGMPPGSLVFTGEQKMANVDITVFNYDETFSVEHNPKSLNEVEELIRNLKGVTWINIDGLHDETFIEGLSTLLDIHKLTMEDILSVGQRPKLEEHSNYLHVVIKEITLDQTEEIIEYEQISFILKDNILVSFQERTGDVFDGVRKRIREGKGTIRKRGADYLMYALLDNVVDHYFVVLETYGEKLEDLETELLENPNNHTLTKLHNFRRETLGLRRTVYPLRELIAAMEKLDDPLFTRENKVFTRDLYDHIIKVIETVEIFRDMTSSLLDLYINSVSNKTNEIMKVLTILTSIFIPLSFISGVYGMNFQNMPELTYKYGYFVILGVMAAVFAGMLIFLRRKKWL
ncbi:MAG TPA: magnesium/cobalt transporter CorA [Draconibacterium sp.]|nr:magnesium/cobalt transporter CorA [Draconibacterium sp.]